jgi:predicted DCC family thiol-disulfide oxidoreductase YuxK
MIYSGIYLVNFVSENKAVHTNSSIVLYDAHCNFCSAIVRYFKQKDNTNSILWLANNSKKGTVIIKELKLEKHIDSIIWTDEKNYLIKSIAIIKILEILNWETRHLLNLFPTKLTDFFYDCIAKNRYLIGSCSRKN